MRIGTGQENNINFWVRPESIGKCPSITVGVKRGSEEELHVNGRKMATFLDKHRTIANTSSIGWVGRGRVDTYGSFDISEVLIYDRALSQSEINHVFRELGYMYSIELLS